VKYRSVNFATNSELNSPLYFNTLTVNTSYKLNWIHNQQLIQVHNTHA